MDMGLSIWDNENVLERVVMVVLNATELYTLK